MGSLALFSTYELTTLLFVAAEALLDTLTSDETLAALIHGMI